MMRLLISLALAVVVVSLVAVACGPAGGPAAKKVDFPAKGKVVTLISPWPAGGPSDVTVRVIAPALEKELGTTVEVANKPGAGSQVGVTELARAKPDGYTIGQVNLPSVIVMYLDPERKAVFSRKNLQPVAAQVEDPIVVTVKADSPFKSMKDLIDAAKANPEKVKVGVMGVLNVTHLVALDLQRLTDTRFAIVTFDGSAPAMTALLGGHVDAVVDTAGGPVPQVKGGTARVLGVTNAFEFLPGVKTMEAQGYQIKTTTIRGYVVPAGTPKEIVDVLSGAFKRAMESNEFKQKLREAGQQLRYMDSAQLASFWADSEKQSIEQVEMAGVKPLKQ